MSLLEKLENIDKPIIVNNKKDYDFLSKMKEYYNLKFEIYDDNLYLFLNDYYKFNYDDGISYDRKINKPIFLIENLDELKLDSSKFFYI